MAYSKAFILCFLVGSQLALHAAEEIQNSTEIIKNTSENNNVDETPRLTQDSYLSALSNSRNSVKSDRSSVVYVTAANQDGSKITQTVNKPLVSVNKPLVSVANKALVPVNKPLVSVNNPSVNQQVKNTPVRREGSYPTGPYAEPNNFYNDGHNNNYNGFSNGYDNGYAGSDNYFPQGNYGPPNYHHQHHVKPSYGPPTGSYGYGPSGSNYGAPIKQDYGIPYGMSSFFDKIKLKLDLFTLGKIILKLIIFKKIVKFIAVICLLLFIPKLIHYKKDGGHDDDDERQFRYNAEGNFIHL